MHNPIIFSDLDGTLLDHDNYSFEAALPALKKLKQHKIPVIATTSKTIQEVINLYKALNISGPFIVENGAAVYIPKATFKHQPKETVEHKHFWVRHFSQPREKYIAIVNKLKARFEHDFTHFAQMSSDDIANATGLSIPEATLANQRQFGEPVLWLSNNLQKQHFITKRHFTVCITNMYTPSCTGKTPLAYVNLFSVKCMSGYMYTMSSSTVYNICSLMFAI